MLLVAGNCYAHETRTKGAVSSFVDGRHEAPVLDTFLLLPNEEKQAFANSDGLQTTSDGLQPTGIQNLLHLLAQLWQSRQSASEEQTREALQKNEDFVLAAVYASRVAMFQDPLEMFD